MAGFDRERSTDRKSPSTKYAAARAAVQSNMHKGLRAMHRREGSHLLNVHFTYWGRRGALSQFTLELARAASSSTDINASFSVSRQNECFADYAELGASLLPIDTFNSHAGALLNTWRIPAIRRELATHIRRARIAAVIELMPHVWSPFIMPAVQAAGIKYCVVVHDARPHPGDRTAWVKPLADSMIRRADTIFTLSTSVAHQLREHDTRLSGKMKTLFHPNLQYGPRNAFSDTRPSEPFRLLFLGRILPYKGLSLFIDTVAQLQAEGFHVEAGVFGEGDLSFHQERLQQINAEVVNRWLSGEEIDAALKKFHAVVLSHIEASQSGVAAAAFGAGVPVIATPVGGLREQVIDGINGTLASSVSAPALAQAAKRLFLSPALYQSVRKYIANSMNDQSMSQFLRAITSQAIQPTE